MDSFELSSKILSLMSLAKKAGKLELGYERVRFSINRYKSCMVILTLDCSVNSLKDIKSLAEDHNVPLKQLNISKKEIANFFDKEYAIISVNDEGFASAIEDIANENNPI